MEITGKITNILPVQTGVGKQGNEWKKQEIIIQTEESYPKTICITLWGNTIDDNIKLEDRIKALIDIESREFNGKWYTTVKARKIDLLSSSNETKDNFNEESPINGNDDLDDFLNSDMGELPF
jgi:hypothetical protein